MAEVIEFPGRTQAQRRGTMRYLRQIYGSSGRAKASLELSFESPEHAAKYVTKMLDYVRFIHGVTSCEEAGQNLVTEALNGVGLIYPRVERELRRDCLKECLKLLDEFDLPHTRDAMGSVHEPWLVRDIILNRPAYQVPFTHNAAILAQNRTWAEVAPHFEDAKSIFWFALPITMPAHSSLEVRARFYRHYPIATSRTLDTIAALIAESNGEPRTPAHLRAGLVHYDTLLHDRLKRKMDERSWLLLDPQTRPADYLAPQTL